MGGDVARSEGGRRRQRARKERGVRQDALGGQRSKDPILAGIRGGVMGMGGNGVPRLWAATGNSDALKIPRMSDH